jgi:AraC family transcriptional regulator
VTGLSPVYFFGRQFKRAVGIAPHQYLTRRRVARAKHLLGLGDLPIAIALDRGFRCQEHLTRVFRKHCGPTPGAYRAMLKASGQDQVDLARGGLGWGADL